MDFVKVEQLQRPAKAIADEVSEAAKDFSGWRVRVGDRLLHGSAAWFPISDHVHCLVVIDITDCSDSIGQNC